FVKKGSVFLFYKYQKETPLVVSLENNWSEIEFLVLNHKKYSLFNAWLNSEKEKVYIKMFEN
ncbi:hypothetical protein CL659_05675, partial [bacterium]|nr:hypothetical protein [bacterium]